MGVAQGIVLAIGQLHVGGTEGQVALLAEGLKQAGLQVAVACLCEGGENASRLERAGVEVFSPRFSRVRGPAELVRMRGPLRDYVRWLRRRSPQVVHAFLYLAHVYTAPASRWAGVPVLVGGRRSLYPFRDVPLAARTGTRIANHMSDAIVVNSSAVADHTAKEEGVAPEKIHVIHNGLSPAAFDPAPAAGLDSKGKIVLCVANLRPVKGQKYLLEAAVSLRAKGRDVSVVLAGADSDEVYAEALRRYAAVEGLDVRFLGSRADVRELMAASAVFVAPSISEGLSNSLLEAMAACLPVIATDAGGNRQALGEAGLLVPARDPQALALAIEKVLSDPDLGSSLGNAARQRALDLFSAESMVDRHIRLYEALLAGKLKKNARGN